MLSELSAGMGTESMLQSWEQACPNWVKEEQIYNCENACYLLEKNGFSLKGLFSKKLSDWLS